MQIRGLDFGNYNTKDSEGNIFPSKISKDEKLIQLRKSTDENLLIYEGKKVLVGEGEFQTDLNKFDKEMFKSCILKVLALSLSGEEEVRTVIGIPGNQYNEKNKDKLKNELLKDKLYCFSLAGKDHAIIVEDVEVIPEIVGAYQGMTKEQKDEIKGRDLVLISLGGGNTNIGLFKLFGGKRKLLKSTTVMSGVLNMYADVINAINGEFSLNKSIEDAENIITKNELIIYGEKQDISFVKSIILDHTDKIFKELNLYPIKDSYVMFTGGASRIYKKLLKLRVPGCIFQTNCLMSTAIGLKKAGEQLWLKQSL